MLHPCEDPLIRVTALTRYYGDLCALDALSFSVAPGEILGLVGSNGAGKTTCLHCVSGIIPPTSGKVEIGGANLLRSPVAAKRRIAFIPDTPLLFEYLTVWEHLQFVARVFQIENWEEPARALLAGFELEDKAQVLPDELSRGMKQKLAICQAFLHEPTAILCDEPLTGLDPVGIRNMRTSLKLRASAGAALVLSSHQLELVSAMCDRVLIVNEGKTVVVGSMDEIRATYPQLRDGASLEDVYMASIGRSDLAPAAETPAAETPAPETPATEATASE